MLVPLKTLCLNTVGFGEEFLSTSSRTGLNLLSSDDKESACNTGDLGSIPRLERSPGRRKWQPTPVFLPGKSHGQRSLAVAGYSPWGHRVRNNWVINTLLKGRIDKDQGVCRTCTLLLLWPQVFSWWASWGYQTVTFSEMKNTDIFHSGLFSSVKQLKDTVTCIPWAGTRTLPRACVLSCFGRVWLLVTPMDCSLPGFSVHGILQAKNTKVGCRSLLQGIFLTQESHLHLLCLLNLAGGFFTTSTTWNVLGPCSKAALLFFGCSSLVFAFHPFPD